MAWWPADFSVASYDMLGQGQSDKPRLFIEQSDQVEVLRDLIASFGTAAGFCRRHQLRRRDCAALCHRASGDHRRFGADV